MVSLFPWALIAAVASVSAAADNASDLLASLHAKVGNALGPIPENAKSVWESYAANGGNLEDLEKAVEAAADAETAPAAGKYKAQANLPKSLDGAQWQYKVTDDKFANTSLLIKTPGSLGIDTVQQYTGYLNTENDAKHFFFWFFESRNSPSTDPVILWLNGGPGCSSLTGLFFENGPATVWTSDEPTFNPNSWNTNANVIYLDQPVNVGYSYSSEDVSDTVTAAEDVYAFLDLFFKQFPQYAKLPFHVAGESYGGHYIPQVGAEILSHSDSRFKLASVLIGNGLTDPLNQYPQYVNMACGQGSGYKSVLDSSDCNSMSSAVGTCSNLIQSCYNSKSTWSCIAATNYCNNKMLGPYENTGLNPYDIRSQCQDQQNLCYSATSRVVSYLNRDDVKAAVGADPSITFQDCNNDVNSDFSNTGDWMKPYVTNIPTILAANVPVLIYAGDKDFICNWLGNQAWTKALNWPGKTQFNAAPVKKWTIKGSSTAGGEVRNYQGFTFARVYNAGHMVPFDQPAAARDMVDRWIAKDYSLGTV